MTEQAREKFEATALVLAAKHYRHNHLEVARRTLFERRTDGTYAIDWVDGAWIGYQAGLEAAVIEKSCDDDLKAGLMALAAYIGPNCTNAVVAAMSNGERS